jgi:glycerol-1-phosphate dehydrogenase [NAD(P)+]
MPVDDPIAALLAGTYPDPETGAPLAAEARAIAIEDTLDGAEQELIAALGLGHRLALVSDVDTHAALGARVARALAPRFAVQEVILDRAPHADTATLARLTAALDPATDAVIAIGSGTLNDLSKLAALALGRPQLVFATAPSMNGYTSLSASLTQDGVKRSIRAATPVAAFFDLGVLAAAPARLIRAGLGDSLCRPTAQADWLLAHLLLDQPYRAAPFALLAADEAALFARAPGLVTGDRVALRHLARTLVLSGFGMTLCGGSYPASQGEHLISHYLDMMRPAAVPDALHGEQIGVCTLVMAALQASILALPSPRVRPSQITRDAILAHFGPALGAQCWLELAPKLLTPARADALNARLATHWPTLRAALAAVTLPAPQLSSILASTGAPLTPTDLSWPDPAFASAVTHARAIRNRFTFLDLAADLA